MIWKGMAVLVMAFMLIGGIVMGQAWEEAPLWKRLLCVMGFALVGIALGIFLLWYIKVRG